MTVSDRTSIRIRKASGEEAAYDRDKLTMSLHRSGASDEAIERVVAEVEAGLTDGMSTRKIYTRAFRLLRKSNVAAASQYHMKSAVMALGPSGYPFEQFVGELFKATGWDVQVGVMLPGRCVTHEVDVYARKDGIVRFTECKFRNEPGSKVDVKVALYVNSRVRDLISRHRDDHAHEPIHGYQGWIVTNSKFTEDAERFGACEGLHLMAWDYPLGSGLLAQIRKTGLLPVTVLHSLSKKQRDAVMARGIVICRELRGHPEVMEEAGIESSVRNRVMDELRDILPG
jgi:hypothetical protein